MQHGLGRSCLDAANDDKVLQAIVSSMTARFGHLSLVERPLVVSPSPTVLAPVNTTTPAGTVPSPSAPLPSAIRELLRTRRKLLHKLSATGFKLRARLSKGVPKARKRTEAPIPSCTDSPFSLVRYEDLFTTQLVDFEGRLSRSDAQEAGLPPVVTFAVQPNQVQPPVNPTVLQPLPSDAPPYTFSSTVGTTEDEVADETMEDNESQPPSPGPGSSMLMEVEARSLWSDATQAPESIQAWFEPSPNWDVPSSIPQPADTAMCDEEQVPTNSESAYPSEPIDTAMSDPSSPQIASSTVPSRDVDMGDAEDGNTPYPLERGTIYVIPSTITTMDSPGSDQYIPPHTPATDSGWDSMPLTANPASSPLPPLPSQSFPGPRSSGRVEHSSAVEANQMEPSPTPTATTSFTSTTTTLNSPASPFTPTPASRLASTQRQAALVQSAPTSNVDANSNSTVAEQMAVPWTSATRSTARPSTATQTSPPTNSRSSPSVVGAGRQVAAWPSGRAPSTTSTTPNVLSTSPAIPSTANAAFPVVAGRQPGPKPTQPSPAETSRQAAACSFGRAPSTVSGAGKVNGPSEDAMDGVESGARVVKGSRRVERLAKMGVTWQGVQQQAQQTQAALAATGSRELNAEELRSASEKWHAAQPPPPPEALPYITTKTKRRTKKAQ
ncbi:hypothetical protein FRC01_002771 [Tulasnella sp. 417]|nr:hypothetical protein FRC01_002771 [Tulasnella sp. 417]